MAWQCIKNKIGFFETSFLKCFSFFSKVKPYIKKYKFYSFQWHFTFNYFQRLIKANNHIFFSQYPVFALPFFFFLMFLSSLNVRYMYIYPQSLFTVKVRLSWTELNWAYGPSVVPRAFLGIPILTSTVYFIGTEGLLPWIRNPVRRCFRI